MIVCYSLFDQQKISWDFVTILDLISDLFCHDCHILWNCSLVMNSWCSAFPLSPIHLLGLVLFTYRISMPEPNFVSFWINLVPLQQVDLRMILDLCQFLSLQTLSLVQTLLYCFDLIGWPKRHQRLRPLNLFEKRAASYELRQLTSMMYSHSLRSFTSGSNPGSHNC